MAKNVEEDVRRLAVMHGEMVTNAACPYEADRSREGLLELHRRIGVFLTYEIVLWEQIQTMEAWEFGKMFI